MDLRKPEDFYTRYLGDFDKDHGPWLLRVPWSHNTSSLWTYLNISYLIRLGIREGFTTLAERKRVDLQWFNKPPWACSPGRVESELALEEEWTAESDDTDLPKLLGIRAYLKVFITALECDDWRKRSFHERLAKLLRESHSKHSDEAYLLINISPYPMGKPWRGLQIDGFAVDHLGNCKPLKTMQFQSDCTGL